MDIKVYRREHCSQCQAVMEGIIAMGNAVFGLKRKVSYDHVPWVTYTDPEIFHLVKWFR